MVDVGYIAKWRSNRGFWRDFRRARLDTSFPPGSNHKAGVVLRYCRRDKWFSTERAHVYPLGESFQNGIVTLRGMLTEPGPREGDEIIIEIPESGIATVTFGDHLEDGPFIPHEMEAYWD